MNHMHRAFIAAVIAVGLLALSGGTSRLEAQRFTCWQCVLDQGSHTYSCQYGASVGNTSCTYVGGEQGCYLGSLCGLYRPQPLADGSFEPSVPGARGKRAQLQDRRAGTTTLLRLASLSRSVERGCNGIVVRREYDEAAVRELRRRSRVIRV